MGEGVSSDPGHDRGKGLRCGGPSAPLTRSCFHEAPIAPLARVSTRPLCPPPRSGCLLALAFLTVLLPSDGAGQLATGRYSVAPGACPDGRVNSVQIENRSIFEVDELEPQSFAWALSLANRLHVRTSSRFIRRELLIREGDCWDPLRAEESARILREYRFIAASSAESEQHPNGDWDLKIRTRDEWSTKLKTTARVDNGIRLERVSVVEENLAGRGILAGAFFEQQREQRDYGVLFEAPQTFGTRLDTGLRVGRTRTGEFIDQSVQYPFIGEVGRLAFRQRYRRRDAPFAWRLSEGDARGQEVLVPVEEEEGEVTLALRIGVPGNLTLLGAGLSFEGLAFPGHPDRVQIVRRGGYDKGDAAPPEILDGLNRQLRPRSAARANFLLGQRNVRFVSRRGLDALTGVQDVQVGVDLGVALARSLGDLQIAGFEGEDDLFTRVSLFLGRATPDWVANVSFQIEGRQLYGEVDGRRGWRDVLAEADLYVYAQPARPAGHTLFLRLSGAGGWTVDTPFQLALGGRNGLRGYPEGSDPGGRRLVGTLEDRILLRVPGVDFMDLGATLFLDAGAIVPGDVPFGTESGLRASVGAGLRLGVPQGSRAVVRLDVAFPVESGALRPVFRLTVGEVVGLVAGVLDEDLQLSRRAGISQTFPGLGR